MQVVVILVLLLSWLVPTINRKIRRFRQWLAVPAHLRSRNVSPCGLYGGLYVCGSGGGGL